MNDNVHPTLPSRCESASLNSNCSTRLMSRPPSAVGTRVVKRPSWSARAITSPHSAPRASAARRSPSIIGASSSTAARRSRRSTGDVAQLRIHLAELAVRYEHQRLARLLCLDHVEQLDQHRGRDAPTTIGEYAIGDPAEYRAAVHSAVVRREQRCGATATSLADAL